MNPVKLARELQGRSSEEVLDVIVQYREMPDDSQHQNAARLGGALRHSPGVINSDHYRIGANAVQERPTIPTSGAAAPIWRVGK
jgi:hypothetical protein